MAKYTSPLDHVAVAAPCSADWDAMIGNERARFCGQCQLNVYNLSGMAKREAEALISGSEGRLCVRFYRRADGTILTKNCPVGLRALKRRLSRVAGAMLSAILSFLSGLGLYTALDERESVFVMGKTAMRREEPPVSTSMGTMIAAPPAVFNGPAQGQWIEGQTTMPAMGRPGVSPHKERDSKGAGRRVR